MLHDYIRRGAQARKTGPVKITEAIATLNLNLKFVVMKNAATTSAFSNLRSVLTGFLTAGAVWLSASSEVLAQPAHLQNGLNLVSQIYARQVQGVFTDTNGVPLNRYGGKWKDAVDPSYIRFASAGVEPANNTTCAPFVTHLLKHAYNWDWYKYSFYDPILGKTTKSASPSSYRYVALIKQLVGFVQKVPSLNLVQPGDVMAMHDLGTSEGHTTIVVNVDWNSRKDYPAGANGADPALAGASVVEVEVLDSSSGKHSLDTRMVPVNGGVPVFNNGAGVGRMGLVIDANNVVLGYTWSVPAGDPAVDAADWLDNFTPNFVPMSTTEIVFGRLPNIVP